MKVRPISDAERARIEAKIEQVGDMVVSMEELMSDPRVVSFRDIDIAKELSVEVRDENILDRNNRLRKLKVAKTKRYIKRKM